MASGDISLTFRTAGAEKAARDAEKVADAASKAAKGAAGGGGGSRKADVGGILADVRRVAEELRKAGGSHADGLVRSLADLSDALKSGDMGGDSLNAVSAAIGDILDKAKRLPPEGMMKFGEALKGIAERSAEVAKGVAEVKGLRFDVGGDGLDALDAIDRRLKAIAEAQDLAKGVREFGGELWKVESGDAAALQRRIDEIGRILSGKLDGGAVKELRKEARALAEEMADLKSESLARVGGAGQSVIASIGGLADSLDTAGDKARDLQDVCEAVFAKLGVSVGRVDAGLAGLIARLPGVGKAVAAFKAALAGPLGWILAVVGAIGTAAAGIIKLVREYKAEIADIRIGNLDRTVPAISEDRERKLRLLDLAIDRRKAEEEAARNLLDTEKAVNDTLLEREKNNRSRPGMSETERNALEHEFKGRGIEADRDHARRRHAQEMEEMAGSEKDIDAKIKIYKEAAKDAQNARAEALEVSNARRGYLNRAEEAGRGVGGWMRSWFYDTETAQEQAEDAERVASEAYAEMKTALEAIERLEKEKYELQKKREAKAKEAAKIDAEAETKRADLAKEREREAFRISQAKERGARERMVRDRDHRETEDENEFDRNKWMHSQDTMEARARILKDGARVDEDRWRKVVDGLEKRHGTPDEMDAETRMMYDNAKADWEHARDRRRRFEREEADIKAQKREAGYAEADRSRRMHEENEDFEREGEYNRAGWDRKVAMDRERYETGRNLRIAAERRLEDRGSLNARQIAVFEAQRERGRSMETGARSSLRDLLREGDRERADFEAKMRGAGGNRLTAMGLGGNGGADYGRATASNTGKLVTLTREMISTFRGGMQGKRIGGPAATWDIH